jgi:uncharacterized protein
MRFNRRARLDTSRIRDRRGARGRSGGVVAGGLGGLLLVVVALVTGIDPSVVLGGGGGDSSLQAPADGGLAECRTAADVEQDADCRFVVVENSVQDFWEREFGERGARYSTATFTAFSGQVATGCGTASSQVGPFYCPADAGVYLDLGFFDVLRSRLGAQGGDFAEAYVIAHEFGHHVQNLAGQMERVRTREGPDSDAVRLELQADCLAGVWAQGATEPGADGSAPLITEITEADIAEGIDAAETVGDDYIQERFGGTVTPETWTHGSSEQRRRWFERGLASGELEVCDTFSATQL